MSDDVVSVSVLQQVAAARSNLYQVWVGVDVLRGHARSAERALDEAEDSAAAYRMEPDRVRGGRHLGEVSDRMAIVQARCSDSASLAGTIDKSLEAAKRHLYAARRGFDELSSAEPELGELKARVEGLVEVIDLAAPLAQAVRQHMQKAGAVAETFRDPAVNAEDGHHTALRFERWLQGVGRDVAKAEEAGRHLDRAADRANADVSKSLSGTEWYAEATRAQERLRAAQHREVGGAALGRQTSPAR